MAITHNVLRQYRDQSGINIQLAETPTANNEINLDVAAVPVAANNPYVIKLTQANLQSVCLYASGPVTIYTNNPSGGSPQDTIPLAAGQTLVWTLATDLIAKCPFSGNITEFYITNAGSGAVAFKFRCTSN
jgi:hypothetical protein